LARPSPLAPPQNVKPAESQTRRNSSKRTTLTQCSAAPSVAPVCLRALLSPASSRHARGTKRASSRSSSRSSLRSTWSLMRSS
jgi:hypothetical protein